MKEPLSQEELIKRVNELKASGNFDLSTEEDLSLAVMNLVSLEEHFFFTGEKTGKEEYFNLLNQTREIRKSLLAKMIDSHEGETWCIAKHLLAAAMRLMEVGTKLQSQNERREAQEMFDKAYELYNLFWALRLKLINIKNFKKVEEDKLNIYNAGNQSWTKEDIVAKLVDCCKE